LLTSISAIKLSVIKKKQQKTSNHLSPWHRHKMLPG